MKHISKIMAFLFTLVLCASILGAVFCLAEHTYHDCSGEGCSVCAVLVQCDQRLRSTAAVGTSALLLLSAFMLTVCLTFAVTCEAACETLVSLKVELLN